MKWIRFLISVIIMFIILWKFNTQIGDLPPVGSFFSPFTGFWQNNESSRISSSALHIKGLNDEVIIQIDDNLVPHIFAKNNHDLYFAQGYITAKYRLWQMEFQTHAAAGRVSEIIGLKGLEYDRQQRRYGMAYAAENSEAEMEKDPKGKEVLHAYTDGVNAWISSLREKDLPIEYKLLNYEPEAWSTLKCALLLKFMAYDLAGRSDDLYVTNILNRYGQATIDSLFNGRPFIEDPIVPKGTPLDFTPVPLPAPSVSFFNIDSLRILIDHQPNVLNGSNNWAVSGQKTVTGYPILCGDPHLGLSLPSLWFQIQLASPDCNVCGVSLPGTPAVIIGFNQKIAWSETNVDADVLDWYSVRFKDDSHNEYFFNNEWRPTKKRIEVIKIRGQKDETDTVVYTHHGPIVTMTDQTSFYSYTPVGHAMRWLGHDSTDELKAVYLLNRAQNYDDYVNALSYFKCPAQNFVYADADNNIAIWTNGEYPLKWKEQGKFLMDGSNPKNDWQGWIPHAQEPHVKNPARQFVSSANELPEDSLYPYYLNWRFETFTRIQRINERLASMNHITADSMRLLQFDEKNLLAQTVLPAMISRLDGHSLTSQQQEIKTALQNWNYYATAESAEQSVFNEWWKFLKDAIWGDEFGAKDMMYPSTDITIETVLYNVNREWIDNKNTPQKETLSDLAFQSFAESIDSLSSRYGSDWKKWNWAKVKDTHINHLLRLPAFSESYVNTGGAAGIVNATGADHGPSWRMIVELGKEPRAFGIYPGGQSGNPGSYFYDNMISKWSKGMQNELVYLHSADDKDPRIVSTLTLKN